MLQQQGGFCNSQSCGVPHAARIRLSAKAGAYSNARDQASCDNATGKVHGSFGRVPGGVGQVYGGFAGFGRLHGGFGAGAWRLSAGAWMLCRLWADAWRLCRRGGKAWRLWAGAWRLWAGAWRLRGWTGGHFRQKLDRQAEQHATSLAQHEVRGSASVVMLATTQHAAGSMRPGVAMHASTMRRAACVRGLPCTRVPCGGQLASGGCHARECHTPHTCCCVPCRGETMTKVRATTTRTMT
eukprot:350353-Chlamydomonas_euryale.AAC.3